MTESSTVIAKQIFLVGKVQGVGFRAAVQKEALRIGGLTGWVANLASGAVQIVMQGEPRKIDEFLQWCHSNPVSGARVDEVVEERVSVNPALKSFITRRG